MGPAKTIDTYLARQAIFDRGLNVVGYEVYFRSGAENVFTAGDPDQATLKVVEGALNTFGLGRLTGAKRGFFSCTPVMLTKGFVTLLPPASTVLEILPSVAPDETVVAACRTLRKQGYLIALDDFTPRTAGPLLPLADILKVDVQTVPADERRAIVRRHARPGLQLLAKKLGVRKELTEAMEMGYQLYQGMFFCRPEMISRKEVPAYKLNYLAFLREINKPDADFDALEKIIRQDVTLSLKLLRYVNSAMLGLRSRVESIRQAMTLLGLNIIRRWVTLLALTAMSDDKPAELVVTSLVRGRFCEHAGAAAGFKDQTSELFMIGMLSIIDAILDRPMLEVLSDLPVSDTIKGALMGKPEGMGRVLSLVLAYEHAEWDRLPVLVERLGIDVMKVPEYYRDAVDWAEEIFQLAKALP